MNRTWVIAVTALAVLVLALALMVTEQAGPPEAVQARAADYARYLSLSSAQTVTIQRIVRAAHPERFEQAMSKLTYADSVYYLTAYGLQQLAESGRPGLTPTYKGARPVPYPPKELWCVRLSNGATIVVGQHQDMYNADWILHEVNADATAASLGCNMGGK